jgi:predicted nucleotidyltransferase
MYLQEYISHNKVQFESYCTQFHISKLYGFGSAAGNSFDPAKSDIDLLVDIDESDPIKRGEYLMNFWDKMESYFKRKVDLLTTTSLKNQYLKKSIDKNKVLLYER